MVQAINNNHFVEMAFDCKLGRQTYALGVLSMTAYPGLNSATKVPQSGPTWMSGFAAVLAHTFPLPRSAMSIQRARLSGYFKAGRRQSGLKPHVGPTVGIGRAFHETRCREWARCSRSRPAVVPHPNLVNPRTSSFGRASEGRRWLVTTVSRRATCKVSRCAACYQHPCPNTGRS